MRFNNCFKFINFTEIHGKKYLRKFIVFVFNKEEYILSISYFQHATWNWPCIFFSVAKFQHIEMFGFVICLQFSQCKFRKRIIVHSKRYSDSSGIIFFCTPLPFRSPHTDFGFDLSMYVYFIKYDRLTES